jgi:hypothetical protein
MEDKFKDEVELPELEKRKKELAMRWNMFGWVPIEEIVSH